ncbi:cobalt ABC transporter ATP-binding protein [Schleiferilactobacillus harbinensis]|jgi:energy-coupling factor transport system permease protein|uniref:Energy-coupling factor transporter transmembrane protein EcfT n=1 Tax=Schleiferilactobacillus harbinensis DSM 16991 TaxID=1122147 RepID=A0A0R1XBA5_9LACO|nr:energy-coupling factor transporter transmembrane component T [Schleiferilactobacillus harbinensis]KRM24646.1 cobalt transport permease [Schleiferilactobacillus harbinensis DSM 16991]QFR64260.1 cobalt ABC transporter ATP-binding protein [Schleiferilactobacillus harbinensis]
MNKLMIGRYLPGHSVVHQMDPRGKMVLTFYFICIVFMANNIWSYLVLGLFTLGAVLLTRLKLIYFWRGIQPAIILILFTLLIQVFFTRGGQIYWQWGPFALSSAGVVNAWFIFFRLVIIICMSTLLTLTTSPLDISSALSSLMTPLKWIRVPVDIIALMLSIALRFVPTLMDETVRIMNAQRARGVDFGSGSLLQQIKAIVPILIPLFVSAMHHAEDLDDAMTARGYRTDAPRTTYRIIQWHRRDTLSIIAFAALTVVIFFVRA